MNIIYKQLTKDKIEAEIKRAKDSGRTIERIELTKDEWFDVSYGDMGRLAGHENGYFILNNVLVKGPDQTHEVISDYCKRLSKVTP